MQLIEYPVKHKPQRTASTCKPHSTKQDCEKYSELTHNTELTHLSTKTDRQTHKDLISSPEVHQHHTHSHHTHSHTLCPFEQPLPLSHIRLGAFDGRRNFPTSRISKAALRSQARRLHLFCFIFFKAATVHPPTRTGLDLNHPPQHHHSARIPLNVKLSVTHRP